MTTGLRPLRTLEDHDLAVNEIERLWGSQSDTPDGDRLEVLATLVDAFERDAFPFLPPDPVDAILFRMEQIDMERKDLDSLIGSCGRVSEILSRQRGLSLAMIRRINHRMAIPLEIRIQPSLHEPAS